MQQPIVQLVTAKVMTAQWGWCHLPLRMRYLPEDPLAVRLDFAVADATAPNGVTWVFGRDLLATGLILPTGEGDVRVRPHGDSEIDVELISADDWCVVRMPSVGVRHFMARTQTTRHRWRAVLDADLDRLLDDILRHA
ncbi:SsgA family sporulation/cell division regulator [Streptomyces inhibens]|uniref:SsgA family sporulation/cell division regulator n=1 Tax=Streptomyces inhibens TaxID=2293571 RepID=UPI0037A3C7E5